MIAVHKKPRMILSELFDEFIAVSHSGKHFPEFAFKGKCALLYI